MWPLVGLRGEGHGDDGIHGGWDGSAPRAHRRRRLSRLQVANRLARRRPEGPRSGEHLVEDHRERVDIGLLGQGSYARVLGRQVLGRGLAPGGARQPRQVAQSGQLHVEELGTAVREHSHVSWPDRAVDEPHVV